MSDERRPGRFVVFEGLDGAGTTTQAARLGERLRALGLSVELTKEPSNGPLGAALRQVIDGRVHLDSTSLALAFAADRADHLFNEHNGIVKLLQEGHWVICDRYVLSSLAYQPDQVVDQRWLEELNSFAIEPDMTIFLDADPQTCLDRIAARSSTTEKFHQSDHLTAALKNYHRVIAHGGVLGELAVVDAGGSIDEVASAVWERVSARLIDQSRTESEAAPAAARN